MGVNNFEEPYYTDILTLPSLDVVRGAVGVVADPFSDIGFKREGNLILSTIAPTGGPVK